MCQKVLLFPCISFAAFKYLTSSHLMALKALGQVVQRLISDNPGLNFNPGFYISLFKSRFGIILPIVFRAFNYQIVVKKK